MAFGEVETSIPVFCHGLLRLTIVFKVSLKTTV